MPNRSLTVTSSAWTAVSETAGDTVSILLRDPADTVWVDIQTAASNCDVDTSIVLTNLRDSITEFPLNSGDMMYARMPDGVPGSVKIIGMTHT